MVIHPSYFVIHHQARLFTLTWVLNSTAVAAIQLFLLSEFVNHSGISKLEYMSDTAVLTFTFRYFPSPLFPLFLTHFFSFAGNLVGFILVGNVLRKAFSILELDERKNRPVVEHGFQVNVTCFFFLPLSPLSLTELFSFWNGLKDLFTVHK